MIEVRDRSWRELDSADELHVLHPDRSTNAAVEFGYSMGIDLEKVVVIAFDEWMPHDLKRYRLRLLMHKPSVDFISYNLNELGLALTRNSEIAL